jgi:hypothetical protein
MIASVKGKRCGWYRPNSTIHCGLQSKRWLCNRWRLDKLTCRRFPANSPLTGKANFGFVSKYEKGANVPTGNTEFDFKVANINFHSSSYDWLVVSGTTKAQYKAQGQSTDKAITASC